MTTCTFCEEWLGEDKRFFLNQHLQYCVAHVECLEAVQQAEALPWVKTSWETGRCENPMVAVCNF